MNKITISSLGHLRSNKALRIILIYSIISLLWIFFSDELVFKIFSNVAAQRLISIFKGSLFVIITSLLLYKLIKNAIMEVMSTQQKLRESDNRLRFALESTNDGLWDVQMKTGEVYISPRGCEILGYRPDELSEVVKVWNELVHPDDLLITTERLNNHLEGRSEIFDVEQRLKMKSGDWLWILTRGKVVARDDNGNPLRMTGTHTDISMRKRAEETIKESEANLNSLINNREESIWSIDNEYNYVTFNNFFCAAYFAAFKIKLKRGMNAIELLTPELRNFWKPKYDTALSGQQIIFEFSTQVEDKIHFYEVYLNPIVSDIKVTGVSALSVDITARKEVEDALRVSEERYRTIFESARDVIYTISSEGNITSINPVFEILSGWTVNEWINKPFGSLVHPEDLPKALDAFRKVMAGEKIEAYEIRILSKSGQYRIGEFTPSPLIIGNETIATLGIARDITERKHAEEELKRTHKQFENTLENMTDGFVALDNNWIYTYVNSRAAKMFNRSIEELIGKHIWTEFPEGIGQPFYNNYYKSIKTRENINFEDYYEPWGRWFENRVIPSDEGLSIFFQDITERKQTEEMLKESEEKYRSIYENSSVAIFLTSPDGKILSANNFACKLFQRTEDEICRLGRDCLVDLTDIRLPSALDERKRTGRAKGELTFIKKDGFQFEGEFSSVIFKDKDGNGRTSLIIRDLTEQKRAEALLIASKEQMRSLAAHLQTVREEERASIAREMHDELGQILTSLKMNITFAKRELEESESNEKKLLVELASMNQTVDKAVTQVRKLITQLRPELIDKLGLVASLEWYSEEYEKTTKIKCAFESNQEELSLNQETDLAIFRIVQETLTNAAKHSGAKSVKIRLEKTDGQLSLEITDDGKGILDEELEGKKSFGLMGMRERASLIGGRLEICRGKVKGTIVRLVL